MSDVEWQVVRALVILFGVLAVVYIVGALVAYAWDRRDIGKAYDRVSRWAWPGADLRRRVFARWALWPFVLAEACFEATFTGCETCIGYVARACVPPDPRTKGGEDDTPGSIPTSPDVG